jgi:two-component system, NarL family, response regulator LiaR
MTTTARQIQVMLVDDHMLVRRGIAAFLGAYQDLQLAGEASDGEAAIDMCEELLPDVVLMDVFLPKMDGATATQIIRQRFPGVQVIALTSFHDRKLVQTLLSAGAAGYLLKDVSAEELAQAIRSVAAGQITLSHAIAKSLLDGPLPLAAPVDNKLTEREHEVLALMMDGLSNAAIAQRLHVTPSTVKTHVSNILSKMGATSRAEAVAAATRQGFAPSPVISA